MKGPRGQGFKDPRVCPHPIVSGFHPCLILLLIYSITKNLVLSARSEKFGSAGMSSRKNVEVRIQNPYNDDFIKMNVQCSLVFQQNIKLIKFKGFYTGGDIRKNNSLMSKALPPGYYGRTQQKIESDNDTLSILS